MSSTMLPPSDGSITVIPGFLDFHATYNADLPWAVFPSKDHLEGVTSISFSELARASHRVAHFARPGRNGPESEVVAVLVNCDVVLYVTLLTGLMRAGIIPFPMSIRNSPEAICNMLEKTNCRRVISQPSLNHLISVVKTQMTNNGVSLRVDNLPSLRSIFPKLDPDGQAAAETVDPYPFGEKPIKPDDIRIYIHSSGSTGFPKPIPQTEKITLQWCFTPTIVAHARYKLRSAAMLTPTFHLMGVFSQLYTPLASGEAVGLFAPQEPLPPTIPNPQNILEAAQVTKCNSLSTVPVFLEQWAQSSDAVDWLKSLKKVRYAGGPLSFTTGNKLSAAGVKLVSVFGATEVGAPTLLFDTDDSHGADADVKTSADWSWMQFSDRVKTRWVDQGDGTYELQFLTCETHQPAVENLSDVRGYSTKDLFQPHPWKKGLWRPVSRLDDVIVLGTGEKIVPIPQEGHIGSLPYVSGAVMFGREKTQAGVLIELHEKYAFDPENEEALRAFRNNIWPHIEDANKLAPTFARIFKEMIIVSDPAKPMARSGKGTVQRKAVISTYADEIEKLYKVIEDSADSKGIVPPNTWDAPEIESWLSELAASINHDHRLNSNVDIFEQGFDSLSVTFLRNRITSALRGFAEPAVQRAASLIGQDFVYAHPTIQSLTTGILRLLNSGEGSHGNIRAEIQSLITKYTPKSPQAVAPEPTPGSSVVLLTGSTGYLGSHILISLLQQKEVVKIYTLNRGNNVPQKQRKSFEAWGIPPTLLEDERLVQLSSDLSRDDFGLPPDILKEIRSNATQIIHNAWRVNFNMSLSTFESYIAATKRLLEFALSFSNRPHFVFTSSIGVTTGFNSSKHPIPEATLEYIDVLETHGNGYAQGKFVVEHILANVNRACAIRTTSVRIGQLAGATPTGAWNSVEWIPSIIKSSIALGYLPLRNEPASWIPIDVAALSVAQIALSSDTGADVLNLVHPRPVTWNQIFTDIATILSAELKVGLLLVPYSQWISKLDQYSASPTEEDLMAVPGLKILKFLHILNIAEDEEHTVQYSTALAEKSSDALRNMPPLNKDQIAGWISHWKNIGFLPGGSRNGVTQRL